MEITFKSAKEFQKCVSAISALIDEGEFFLTDEGLKLRAMDPSQIAMVDFLYPKEAMEKFEGEDGEKFGVSLSDFDKVMRRAKSEDKLTIKMEDGRLILLFRGKTLRKFVIPILDLGTGLAREPKIPFDATVRIYSDFMKDSLKDASIVSSHVTFKVTPEAFYMEAKGDKGEVNIIAEKGQDILIALEVTKEARAMFPLGYLNDLINAADSGSQVEINLKTDAPLKMTYKIGDGKVSYYVAPRIEAV